MKKNNKEVWKNIKNTNGFYKISNFGRLKSLITLKIMSPGNRKGYLKTTIIINNCYKSVSIHRLVGEAFIPNPDNKSQINHKDFNRSNNHVDNLEWVTPKENFLHAKQKNKNNKFFSNIGKTSNLKHLKGSQIGTSKLNDNDIFEIRNKFVPRVYTRNMLAEEYNISPATVKDIVLGKSWRHLL